jgi:Fe-S cluster assembly protein SufD
LRDRRVGAAERWTTAELPTSAEEVWRYSRIDELDLDEFAVVTPSDTAPPVDAALTDVSEWAPGAAAATVVLVDDRVVSLEVSPAATAAGLVISDLSSDTSVDPADAGLAEADDAPDLFATLNDAFSPSPIVVSTPVSAEIEGTVHVVRLTTVAGGASFGRLVVHVGRNSRLALVEHHRSTDVHALTVPYTELHVANDARLHYLAVNDLGPQVWQVADLVSRVEQGGSLIAAAAGFGGDYTRLRSDCRLTGRGSSGDLLAIYFGDGDQMLDYRTFQDHRAPDTTSDLLFKGAVGGRSRSVYTGLIRVRKEGTNTNANQTNRNLKLSDEAWAESVPNLEIETNDVKCSHASAVGPIDEEQRFYLESRGVMPADAERLVLTGFFEEVIARLPIAGAAEPLRRRVRDKVARRIGAGEVNA